MGRAPFEILRAWHEGRFHLEMPLRILEEYRQVLDELTKRRAEPVLTSVLKISELHSKMVEPVSFAPNRFPDDDKFLEAAAVADASYVVCGDAALGVFRIFAAEAEDQVRDELLEERVFLGVALSKSRKAGNAVLFKLPCLVLEAIALGVVDGPHVSLGDCGNGA